MPALTPDDVLRRFETDGVPASGFHKPYKQELAQLLNRQESLAAAGTIHKATRALLYAITPPSEDYGGIVYADTTSAYNGYYVRSGGAWSWVRKLPDTLAKVTLGGTVNTRTGSLATGVNPADVLEFFAIVPTGGENTTAMTMELAGGAAQPVLDYAGNALASGDFAGVARFVDDGAGNYRLSSADNAAKKAAESATEAAESATEAAASAATATTQAGIATTKAAEALTSADNAAASEIAAQGAKDTAVAAADVSGPFIPFDTKADADAALGGLANGDIVEVFVDETQNNARTRYQVVGGAFVLKLILSSYFAVDTLASLATGNLPGHIQSLTALGHTAIGDCPTIHLKRVMAPGAPTPGHVQANDGSWWYIVNRDVSPGMAGLFNDGATDVNPILLNASSARSDRPLQAFVDWAADAGRTVVFEKGEPYLGTYPLAPPVRGCRWRQGAYKNTGSDAQYVYNAALSLGGWHPFYINDFTTYALNAVAHGDGDVTTVTATDAGNFSEGQIVWVRETHGYKQSDANPYFMPAYGQLNRVTSANAATGAIVLEDPISWDSASMVIHTAEGAAVTDLLGYDMAAIVEPDIEGMSFYSDNASAVMRGGVYKPRLHFGVLKGVRGFTVNAIAFGDVLIDRIEANATNVEMSMMGHHSTVTVKSAKYVKPASPAATYLTQIGEECTYCFIRYDGSCDWSEYDVTAYPIQIVSANYCGIEFNGTLDLTRGKETLCHIATNVVSAFAGAPFEQFTTTHNRIAFADVLVGADPTFAYRTNDNTGGCTDNILERGRFLGGTYAQAAIRITGARNHVGNDVYVPTGKLELITDGTYPATNCEIAGRIDDGYVTTAGLGDNDVRIRTSREARLRDIEKHIVETDGILVNTTVLGTDVPGVSVTVPADTLYRYDGVHIRALAVVAGTTATKNIRWMFNTAYSLGNFQITGPETGGIVLDLYVKARATSNGGLFFIAAMAGAHAEVKNTGHGPYDITAGLTLQLQSWMNNAADSITFYNVEIQPMIALPGAAYF